MNNEQKPQPAPQGLRERANTILLDVLDTDNSGRLILNRTDIITAMLQFAAEVAGEKVSEIISYIENDSEVAIPIDRFFNDDGSHITKKQYGRVMLEVLCNELRLKFKS